MSLEAKVLLIRCWGYFAAQPCSIALQTSETQALCPNNTNTHSSGGHQPCSPQQTQQLTKMFGSRRRCFGKLRSPNFIRGAFWVARGRTKVWCGRSRARLQFELPKISSRPGRWESISLSWLRARNWKKPLICHEVRILRE